MPGAHVLTSSGASQAAVALSSGEAGCYGVVRAARTALGQQALFTDLGLSTEVRAGTDSSATIGNCSRQVPGRLRHVDANTLRVLGNVGNGETELHKVRAEVNPADLFIKHRGRADRVGNLVKLVGCRFADCRPAAARQLRREPSPWSTTRSSRPSTASCTTNICLPLRTVPYYHVSGCVSKCRADSFIVAPEVNIHDQVLRKESGSRCHHHHRGCVRG